MTKCPECDFALWVSPVPKDISIHKLRHTTGTLLSKAGVTILRPSMAERTEIAGVIIASP